MRGHLHSITSCALLLAASAASFHGQAAETATAAAGSDNLCLPSLQLDKEKLATHLLDIYPVSTRYLTSGANGAQRAPLTSNKALLHWILTKRAATVAQDSGRDAANVDRIAAAMQDMLDGKNGQLTPSTKTDPIAYLGSADSRNAVRCQTVTAKLVPPAGAPTDGTAGAIAAGAAGTTLAAAPSGETKSADKPAGSATGAKPAISATENAPLLSFARLRVRGNPDQLSIDRSDTAAYGSAERATVALSNDSEASSRTNDIKAYVGYSWLKSTFNDSGSNYEAVPYVGVRQNRIIVTDNDSGEESVTTSRTTSVGILGSLRFFDIATGNSDTFTLRPDFMVDTGTGSRLLSANFTYTPLRRGWLNDSIRTNYGVAVKPILVAESRNGTYFDRGDDTVSDDHDDFMRLGARAGFALASTNPDFPVDFVTTYTALKALVGDQNIHYLQGSLVYNFNQNLGLSLNYGNGLLPENGNREKKWNLGVNSKF